MSRPSPAAATPPLRRDPPAGDRLGEILVRDGKVSRELLRKALELKSLLEGRLGTNLLELGAIGESELLEILGRQRGTRTAAGGWIRDAPTAVVKMIPAKLARRYKIVAFRLQGKTLYIASSDPVDALIEDEIGLLTGCMVKSCLGLEVRIFEALERHYGAPNPVRFGALARRLNASDRQPAPQPASAKPVPARPAPTARQRATPAGSRRSRPPRPPSLPEIPLFIELSSEEEALLRKRGNEPTAQMPSADRSQVFPWREDEFETPGPTAEPTAGDDRPDVETRDFRPDELSRAAPPESNEDRLHRADRAFQQAEIRDEIADVLLEFCAPFFRRRLVLIRRQGKIVGWRGEGEGVDAEMVRGIEIKADEPSIFLGINESSFWLGPLPRLPPNESLIIGLDGPRPRDCVVLPITLLGKIVCYLYGDNLDGGVAGAPIAELRRLAAKAAVAFELYILKNKIRMI